MTSFDVNSTELRAQVEQSVDVTIATVIPAFVDLARLIVPENTPDWLPVFLEWWSAGFRHDQLVDKYRPTKAETRERLLGLKNKLDGNWGMTLPLDDLIHELAAPPNRRGKHIGEFEHHFYEGAVMVAFAMHLLRTETTREVTIHPDGTHGKQFDFKR